MFTVITIEAEHNTPEFRSCVVNAIKGPYPIAGVYMQTENLTPTVTLSANGRATIKIGTDQDNIILSRLIGAGVTCAMRDGTPLEVSPSDDLQKRLHALMPPPGFAPLPSVYYP